MSETRLPSPTAINPALSGGTPPVTSILADFIASFHQRSLPEAARQPALLHLVDTLGVIIGGSREPAARIAQAYVAALGSHRSCTLLGTGLRAAAPLVALANGTAAHALEFEDGHDEAGLHPSVCVIPAALAVAERRRGSLGQLVDAIVLGYEIACRLARCCQSRRAWIEPSWHFTTLCGTFGATAAAAYLEGLAAEKVEQALGITTSLAAGHILAEHEGADSKFLQAGWGAQAGIVAVDLAARGLTAPKGALEHPAGFLPLYIGDYALDPLLSELGAHYEVTGASLKPYPTCRFTHGVIDAVLWLRKQPGVDSAEPAEIELRLPPTGYLRVVEPLDSKERPANPIVARFSAPYVAALAWRRGAVELADFGERFPDPACLELAARIKSRVDASLGSTLYAAEVVIRGPSGEVRRRTLYPRGAPQNPLDWDDVAAKLHACVGPAADAASLQDFVATVRGASRAFPVRALLAQAERLRAPERAANRRRAR